MLTCPLCQSEYATTGDFQPRLLSGCGHTFCQKCLDGIKPKAGNQLECPQCSLVSAEPHVPNITIMNYVDAQDVNHEQLVHQVPAPQRAICQDCQQNVATLICFQCLPAGFKFCDNCSTKEHNRPFGPVREHHPKPIASVRFTTPVPNCSIHPGKACLFFSFQVNKFGCEVCREERNFKEDKYVPIDDAVSQIRDEVPGLIQLTRDRVDDISHTRAELEELLGRVDSEKTRTLDFVRVEFNQFEVCLKKRLSQVLAQVEDEAQFQKKKLTEQQEKLEVAQGAADTAIVQANMLLQMSDYSYLHQADRVIENMRSQLADVEFPLYKGPVTNGSIPININPAFLQEIDNLGMVGGGRVPVKLQCVADNGLLMMTWEHSDKKDQPTQEYEIRVELMEEEDVDAITMASNAYIQYKHSFPRSISIKGRISQKRIDNLIPGKKYCCRIRSLNSAGWGIWSSAVVGQTPDFPLEIGYTGEILSIQIPADGYYCITARGAKAADGDTRKGGRGAIIEAKFHLGRYNTLIILCGGMSKKVGASSGGAGGTFVALNKRRELLIAAGGGGGTRGYDAEDHDGRDANIHSDAGTDGLGSQWAAGGAGGGAGKDAMFAGPCWGWGGAGFDSASSTAKSFLHGGEPGDSGGFGGGGAVGYYGGGGGGGYSGGGGGRGGGGGGCYVKEGLGLDEKRSLGNEGNGSVTIVRVITEI